MKTTQLILFFQKLIQKIFSPKQVIATEENIILIKPSPCTDNPKFMSRGARIRAGLQPHRLTWYQARRLRSRIATLQKVSIEWVQQNYV